MVIKTAGDPQPEGGGCQCSGTSSGVRTLVSSVQNFKTFLHATAKDAYYLSLEAGKPNMLPGTMSPHRELSNFDTYVAYMEYQGAAKAGIARIVPLKNWTARKAGYDPAEVDIIKDKPVKQNIAITIVPGAFTTIADRSIHSPCPSISVWPPALRTSLRATLHMRS